jgi:hypothetical protein
MGATLNLHDKDFFAWTQEQAKFLKEKAFDKLDITHLFEEVESMGNQNKTELRNRLAVLLMHLLKWKYQPELKGKSWFLTIVQQRSDIEDLISDNPSLKHFLPEIFIKAYHKAVTFSAAETGIKKTAFPKESEWTIEQVFDEDFFPN